MLRWNPFFLINGPTLYFVYGLSFFLLGFAIYIQPRRDSRLKLAKSLPLLAGFALIHGMAEWGYLFIPVIAGYFAHDTVQGLEVIQRLLWVVSFVFLLGFGISFFPQLYRRRRSLWILAVITAAAIAIVELADKNLLTWPNDKEAEIISRYLLCIPGAALSAIGLCLQREELGRLGSKRLLIFLWLAVISFGGYAVAGGLVVPKASFFPAALINVQTFRSVFGFPVELARAGLGALTAVSILKLLSMFDLEEQKRISEITRREAMASERERIARDLHDGVIQSIYGVGLTLQRMRAVGDCNPQSGSQLDYVLKSLDDVVSEMRFYIQNLLPSGAGEGIASTINWFSEGTLVPVEVAGDGRTLAWLTPQAANNVNLMIKEAMSNVAKHAHATETMVHFVSNSDGLEVTVKDNGRGLSGASDALRVNRDQMGLKNLNARATALNGTCMVDFTDQGTTVRVWIPWEGNVIEG